MNIANATANNTDFTYTVDILNNYKNEILNYLATKYGSKTGLYIRFMNNKITANTFNTVRKYNGYAHFMYENFREIISTGNVCYSDPTYLYVISSVRELFNIECFIVESKMLDFWNINKRPDHLNILLIDKFNSKIAEIPVDDLINLYAHHRIISTTYPFESDFVGFDLTLKELKQYFKKIDNSEYVPLKMEFETNHNFDPNKWWKPEYIGKKVVSDYNAIKDEQISLITDKNIDDYLFSPPDYYF